MSTAPPCNGQKSEALHYIVAVTAVGSLLFTALWTLSRHKATIRGLLLTAAALGVFAAVAALIADYSGAEALPILSGVVIVFAAAGGAATSSTRSTWMYHNLGHENDTEMIIFCQIVLGVTATGVGLGLQHARSPRHSGAGMGHAHPVRLCALPCAKRTPRPHRGDPPRACTQQSWAPLRRIPLVDPRGGCASRRFRVALGRLLLNRPAALFGPQRRSRLEPECPRTPSLRGVARTEGG